MIAIMRRARATTLAALLTVPLAAPGGPPPLAAGVASASRTVLANGAEILVIPQPGVPLVAVVSVIRSGASSEGPGENGISHMLEHLLFNGTDARTQEQLYDDLDRRGIVNNAHTGVDEMTLFMLGPAGETAEMLAAESEMLFRSNFPEAKLAKERGIVLNEIAKDATQEATRFQEALDAILYAGTPCALPVTGTDASIRSLTRDAIVSYHRRHYRPDNLTVLVMGDVTPGDALARARAAFGGIAPAPEPPGGAPPACRPAAAAIGVLHSLKIPGGSRRIALAAEAPSPRDPRHPAASLLAAMIEPGLVDAANGRREGAPGKILDASVELAGSRGGALLEITATLDDALPYDAAMRALTGAVRERLTTPPDPDDLAHRKVADRVTLSLLEEKPHYFGLDRAPTIACCGWQAVVDGPAKIAAVTATDVAAVAASLADSGRWSLFEAGPDVTEGTRPALVPASAPASVRTVLPNGLTVLVRSGQESSVFAAALLTRARSAREPESRGGIADLLHRLAGHATASRSASRLESDLTRIGARVKVTDDPSIPYDDADTTSEFSFMRMETLDEFAPEAIPILAEMVRSPALDTDSIERMRGLQIERARQGAARPGERGRGLLLRALLGKDAPLGRSPFGTEESVKSITAADLDGFRRIYFTPSNLILSVATSLPPEAALDLVRGSFGAMEAGTSGAIAPPATTPAAPSRVEEKLGGAQAYVLEGVLLDPKPAEVPALAAAAAILSKRMGMEIREKKGLAYSLGAGAELFAGHLLFTVRVGTKPEQLDEALAAVDEQIRELATRPPTEDEIASAIRSEGVRILMRGLSRINKAFAAGLDELRAHSAVPAPWRELPTVTPADVAGAAKAYLATEKMTRVILR
ncbi:MAG: insulinase family protein [Acidobacteria bacterium]|nr:insulinase family protein [Acidobacteriota bacterium]